MTSEKLYVGSLEMASYEGRVSELHAWQADRMALSQQGCQKERAEECHGPHEAEPLKSRNGGGTQ